MGLKKNITGEMWVYYKVHLCLTLQGSQAWCYVYVMFYMKTSFRLWLRPRYFFFCTYLDVLSIYLYRFMIGSVVSARHNNKHKSIYLSIYSSMVKWLQWSSNVKCMIFITRSDKVLLGFLIGKLSVSAQRLDVCYEWKKPAFFGEGRENHLLTKNPAY